MVWRKPLAEKSEKQQFDIHIIPARCKGCGFCVEFCPKHVLEFTNKFNEKGYYYPDDVKKLDCIGCKLCENICPEFSIYIQDHIEKKSSSVKRGKNGKK